MTSQSLDTKQSEYTYYPIFREGNQTMKFGQLRMLTRDFFFFFLKNYTQNVMEKLVQDPFLKN